MRFSGLDQDIIFGNYTVDSKTLIKTPNCFFEHSSDTEAIVILGGDFENVEMKGCTFINAIVSVSVFGGQAMVNTTISDNTFVITSEFTNKYLIRADSTGNKGNHFNNNKLIYNVSSGAGGYTFIYTNTNVMDYSITSGNVATELDTSSWLSNWSDETGSTGYTETNNNKS